MAKILFFTKNGQKNRKSGRICLMCNWLLWTTVFRFSTIKLVKFTLFQAATRKLRRTSISSHATDFGPWPNRGGLPDGGSD